MKTGIYLAGLFVLSGMMALLHAESRVWTNTAGKTLEGELVARKGDSVSIKTTGGKTVSLKLSMLSEQDKSYADGWSAPSPTKMAGADAPKVSNLKFKWNKNDDAAFKQAAENKLPVAILFTGTSWCGYCIKLEKEILSKKEFKDGMGGLAIGLICVSPSAGQWKGYGKELSKKYAVSGVPAIVVVDAEGKELGRTGYIPNQSPEEYIKFFRKYSGLGE